MAERVKFRGIVTFQRFYNEDSYWGVFIVKTKDETLPHKDVMPQLNVFEDDPDYEPYYVVTVCGKMQQLYVGSEYEFTANVVYNNKFKSWQYEPDSVIAILPSTIDLSRTFLSAILTERQTNVLLTQYPNIVQEIYEGKDNVDISKLNGIGDKTYNNIKEKVIQNYGMSEIIVLLSPYGVTNTAIKNLLKWESSPAILKHKIIDNPYELTNAKGFGFTTVDKIALKMNPELINSGKRLFAYLKYALQKYADELGHTWIHFSDMQDMISNQIPQCSELFDKLIKNADNGAWGNYFCIENNKIGLKKYKDCETAIYDILINLENSFTANQIDTDAGIIKTKEQLGYDLNDEQKDVVKQIENSNVVIFTGAAGCGKSTTARAILNSLCGCSIACCSLSAKAAQRIQEATGFEATTAHRMLKYKDGHFEYNINKRMPYDVVFIDEASMINCHLFYSIVSAIKDGAKLIICGDYAQLPPIGAGNIFADILHMTDVFNITVLTKVHRQAESSGILVDANKIRKSKCPIGEPKPIIRSGKNKDMIYIFRDDKDRIQHIAVDQFLKIAASKGLDNVICITPRRQIVTNSALEINKQIQRNLIQNKDAPYIQGVENRFYVGDRIIQIENDSEKNVYNGEVGFVDYINPRATGEDVIMTARFKSTLDKMDKLVDYTRNELDTILLGYALTCHKAQGSEYDYVIVVIDNTHYVLLDNCLLYTAITRAKETCILISQPEAFYRAMKVNFNRSRQTWLRLKYEEVD